MTGCESHKNVIICIVLLTFTLGCASARPISNINPQALQNSISVDDVVEIEELDGTRHKFQVSDVSTDGLYGMERFVPYTEIQTISVYGLSMVRTGLLVAALIAIAVWADKHADCDYNIWEEPCDGDEYD